MAFDPSIRDATSFIYPGGVFRWKRIPMGWKSAGAHFQQQLAGVLNGLLYKECELYMDDNSTFRGKRGGDAATLTSPLHEISRVMSP
jgi:hypothetical protein